MKKLFATLFLICSASIIFGQEISKRVEWRLNPIINSVKVSETEKTELVKIIEKFQTKEIELRALKTADKAELQRVNTENYLSDIKNILGKERFKSWKNAAKKKQKSKKASNGVNDNAGNDYSLNVDDMLARDPFIYVDQVSKLYYMHLNDKLKIGAYKSPDLKNWKRVGTVFDNKTNFWGTNDFWAPDTYKYNGKYYIFASFSNPETTMKGTSILVSNNLEGPFKPLVNKPITPSDWKTLDGTLYIDDDQQPWLLFCRAFHSVPDGAGRIYAQKLSSDLKTTQGEPILLFKASDAPWAGTIGYKGTRGYVTDSPIIYKAKNGELLMLWSSFTKAPSKYAIGVARSSNGKLDGIWTHDEEILNQEPNGGGHAMIFTDLNNQLRIAYHTPNKMAKPKFYFLEDKDGKLKINAQE